MILNLLCGSYTFFKSKNHPFIYVGMTGNLEKRFASHNAGENQSTKHYLPFTLVFYLGAESEQKAREMERYFKGGSGKAFIKRHFLS